MNFKFSLVWMKNREFIARVIKPVRIRKTNLKRIIFIAED